MSCAPTLSRFSQNLAQPYYLHYLSVRLIELFGNWSLCSTGVQPYRSYLVLPQLSSGTNLIRTSYFPFSLLTGYRPTWWWGAHRRLPPPQRLLHCIFIVNKSTSSAIRHYNISIHMIFSVISHILFINLRKCNNICIRSDSDRIEYHRRAFRV